MDNQEENTQAQAQAAIEKMEEFATFFTAFQTSGNMDEDVHEAVRILSLGMIDSTEVGKLKDLQEMWDTMYSLKFHTFNMTPARIVVLQPNAAGELVVDPAVLVTRKFSKDGKLVEEQRKGSETQALNAFEYCVGHGIGSLVVTYIQGVPLEQILA